MHLRVCRRTRTATTGTTKVFTTPISSSFVTTTTLLPPPPALKTPWQNPTELLPPSPHLYAQLLFSWTQQCSTSRSRHLFEEKPQWARNCRVVHARILRFGFLLLGNLGNSLVDLYAKSGDLWYAKKTLNGLEECDTRGWNSVLSVQSRMGSPKGVVLDFVSLRVCGVAPDQFSFAIVLSACGRLEEIGFGKMVHCDALRTGFVRGSFCVSALIDMYGKCRYVDDARRLFDEVDCPDAVAWTTMISGYVRIDKPENALYLFDRMRSQEIMPDQVAFVTAVAACVIVGRLEDATDLFAQMSCPNEVAWNCIISGHAQNGHEVEALGFFKGMRDAGIIPTRSTLGSVLSATANLADIDVGCQVHSLAIKTGLESDVFVGSSLVSMYAKSHAIHDARDVFDMLEEKNLVTWNAILGGYAQNGQPDAIIELFLKMKEHGFQGDEFTYVSLFGACPCLENLKLGRQLHSVIIKYNLDKSLFVGNAIVDMYAKSGELNDAKRQFHLVAARDIVTWNAIIVGHVHNEYKEEALSMFHRMILDGLAPDKVSCATILGACADLRAFDEGQQVHCLSIKCGLETNVYVGSSIINFYSKLGETDAANRVFMQMPERSLVSRNALIEGYVLNNKPEEALNVFQQLLAEGVKPSECTFASILPSLGPDVGGQLHCHILKSGALFKDVFLGVSLVGMYLRSHSRKSVDRLFSDVPYNSNVVFWTAAISGQSQNDPEGYALLLFSKMRKYDVQPDQATYVTVLRVCADLASVNDGKEVHSLIIRTGYYSDECTGSSLVDMYSKCGDVRSSHQVFNEMENKKDVVSWNSMLVGFAKNGFAEEALLLFSQMKRSRIQPDAITFLGVLTACSHAGLVSRGQSIFACMSRQYGIKPRYDHYACVVDLLVRGGYLSEAEEFIKRMPFEPDGVIWATVLSACSRHGDVKTGRLAAEKLIKMEPQKASSYVLLSNMCAASANWDGVKRVRQAMSERRVIKSPGCSWIVLGRKTSIFVAGDETHPDALDIYATLKHLTEFMREDGYVSEHDFLWHDDG